MKATFDEEDLQKRYRGIISFTEEEQEAGLPYSLEEYLTEVFDIDCYAFHDRLSISIESKEEYTSVLEKVLQGIGFLQFQ